VPSIIYVVYLKALYSIIDYIQEAGRARKAGEHVTAMIIIEDKDWLIKDLTKDSDLKLKTYKVNSLIRTRGCRRSILSRYLNSDLQNYKGIDAVLYNNY
jgi:superfamily II DNA helicase RecQ